jgi:hypothetical protein
MPDWSESSQSGTGMKKNSDAGTILVPKNEDPVRYQTEMIDAGIPMPAAPSYGLCIGLLKGFLELFRIGK